MVFNNLGGFGPGHLDEPHELRLGHVAESAESAVDVVPWDGDGLGGMEVDAYIGGMR